MKKNEWAYEIYNGRFDTPKKLNRSDVVLPDKYIDAIEAGDITSEMLSEINQIVPVFVYKTLITIHGNLPSISRQSVGSYKNLIQNKNGSLEIRYNAIDLEKKRKLMNYLPKGYGIHRTSATSYITYTYYGLTERRAYGGVVKDKSQKEAEAQKAEVFLRYKELKTRVDWINNNPKDFFLGKFYLNIAVDMFGDYVLLMHITPFLLKGDLAIIAAYITGETVETVQDRYDAIIAARQKSAQESEALDKKKKESRLMLMQRIAHLPKANSISDGILVNPYQEGIGDGLTEGFCYTKMLKKGVGSRVVIIIKKSPKLLTNVKDIDFTYNTYQRQIDLSDIERIKNDPEYRIFVPSSPTNKKEEETGIVSSIKNFFKKPLPQQPRKYMAYLVLSKT